MRKLEAGSYVSSAVFFGLAMLGLYDSIHNIPEARAEVIRTTAACTNIIDIDYSSLEKRSASLLASSKTLEELAKAPDSLTIIDCHRFVDRRVKALGLQPDGSLVSRDMFEVLTSGIFSVLSAAAASEFRRSRISSSTQVTPQESL